MSDTIDLLAELGWRQHFAGQLQSPADGDSRPARVTAVERSVINVLGADFERMLPAPRTMDEEDRITVGDWVLVDAAAVQIRRRLERFGAFTRRAAGTARMRQLIAANVDTLFIVSSANRDFNLARLERYLALAHNGGATPVIVLTKADLNPDTAALAADAMRLAPGLLVEWLDARESAAAQKLSPWCTTGQTVALLGSSGVGKSTLVNTLAGAGPSTREIRATDQRGRHSTTSRSMHRLHDGGWLIDTPGMRELKLVDADEALDEVFDEIAALAATCRFTDCLHVAEPGCAVQAAIENRSLDPERLQRYLKLVNENRYHSETLAERRARFRSAGKIYKSAKKNRAEKRGES
jgi:ribosome biogenesis GTPase